MDRQHSLLHCSQCLRHVEHRHTVAQVVEGELSYLFAQKEKLEQRLHAAMASGSLIFCALGLMALEHF